VGREFIKMKGHPRRELKREMSMGYTLEQVVADLVDNSIDAQAEHVEVIFDEEQYGGAASHYVIVADDGKGIEGDDISSIMDFGVERSYGELELGKFGVGLKSSSLSQASEITVLSKIEGGSVNLRRLSAKIVEERDEWVLVDTLSEHQHTDAVAVARALLDGRPSGTVVVLEDMHKLDLRVGDEEHKAAYLDEEYQIIREYLSLVFERYLAGTALERSDGTTVERSIRISFNGPNEVLRPLDPFLRELQDGSRTGTLCYSQPIRLDHNGSTHHVNVTIWITPNESDRPLGYDKRIRRASRDLSIRELQGFYFYRNGRLIDFPGWKKLVKVEEHGTCLRWEIEFPSSADDLFQIDPSKRGVELPAILRTPLAKMMAEKRFFHPTDTAKENHRRRARRRQGGKDAATQPLPPTGGSPPTGAGPSTGGGATNGPATPTGPPAPGPAPKPKPPAKKPLRKVRIKSMRGTLTGNLVVNEKQEGDTWVITLNEAHSMYEAFRDTMRER